MAHIFDKFKAKVRSVFAEKQTDEARVTENGRIISDHPSNHITPAKLKSIFDDAENGDIMTQHELFMDIEERDGDISANMGTRKRALLTLDWQIMEPRNATPKEQEYQKTLDEFFYQFSELENLVVDLMDAVGHGFSALEINWQFVNGKWLPNGFIHRPQSWFRLDKDDNILLKTPDNVMGEPLRTFGWVVHIHKNRSVQLARQGLYRTLAWHYMFKHYSVHDFAEFLELYGMPIRIGKYGAGATSDEKRTLLKALAQIGHNAAGIMPESMQVELHNAANSTGQNNPFLQMVGWCEKEIARLILGQTLTSGADGKTSTNALGQVHNEVRRDLLIADAKLVSQTITKQIILPYLQINVDPNIDESRCPRFEFDTKEYEDLEKFAKALPPLVNIGVEIPERWVRNKLGIPEVQDGEMILKAVQMGFNGDLNERETALKSTALSHPEGCLCGCGENRVALSSNNGVQDIQAGDFTPNAQQLNAQMLPIIQQLATAFAQGQDYEDVQQIALSLYGQLNDEELINALTQALFIADIWGRVNVKQ